MRKKKKKKKKKKIKKKKKKKKRNRDESFRNGIFDRTCLSPPGPPRQRWPPSINPPRFLVYPAGRTGDQSGLWTQPPPLHSSTSPIRPSRLVVGRFAFVAIATMVGVFALHVRVTEPQIFVPKTRKQQCRGSVCSLALFFVRSHLCAFIFFDNSFGMSITLNPSTVGLAEGLELSKMNPRRDSSTFGVPFLESPRLYKRVFPFEELCSVFCAVTQVPIVLQILFFFVFFWPQQSVKVQEK